MISTTHYRVLTAEQAVSYVQSFNRVFLQGGASTPLVLAEALATQYERLKQVEIVCLSTLGTNALFEQNKKDSFYTNALFVSAPNRRAIHEGRGDYIPIFLSEIPLLFKRNILPIDVAMVHVSPPDKHGFCSLGLNVDISISALKSAKLVIAQINPQMPRTHGDGFVHLRDLDIVVEVDHPLPTLEYSAEIGECEKAIGSHCASLIEDGSTLQMGIGVIPNAVLNALAGHKNLGIHTEMFSDGILPLLASGVINNSCKKKHRRKVATAFALGSQALYDTVNDNPNFAFLETDYVNDVYVIKKNPKVVAINSAIEIDLTGQVCADSIGTFQYSGVGGQMDFMRGAALSEGGKPIIAMAACTKKGDSKIVPFLKEGAGVVSTRAHVHYVVTEFGVAYLYGKSLKQRALALIQIAAPQHQSSLLDAYKERFEKK